MAYTPSRRGHWRSALALVLLALVLIVPSMSLMAGQLVVTSLPYTVSQTQHTASTWDTVTISGTKLTSSRDGLLFAASAHHWLVLLDRDTIIFGTDSTYRPGTYTGARGIDIGSNCHDITIKGGYIIHQPANVLSTDSVFRYQDTVNAYNLCIDGGYATYNLLIDSVREARVRGYNSHVMSGGQKMVTVRSSRFFNDCYAYSSRELFQCCCIKFEGAASDLSAGEYHYRILNCYLEDNAHAAVYSSGTSSSTYTVMQLDGDTIKVDSRNKRYTSSAGTGASNTNAYGIQFTYGGPGSYIKNCVITSGTRYSGGRGIQFVRSLGTQANPIEIAYNRVDCHEGLNVEFGTLYYGCGVKIRQNCKGVWLHHNAIVWTADTSQTIGKSYQPKGEALMYQMGFDAGGAYTGPYYITMENNACSTKVLTNVNNSEYDLSVVDFETCEYSDTTVVYRYNKTYSSGNHVYNFGQYDGGGSYLRMYGDTAGINPSSVLSPRLTFCPGDYRGAHDNWATDFYFNAPAADTSVGFYFQGISTGGSNTQNIKMRRTVSVYVKGSNGLPVVGAAVTVRNNYGQTVLTGSTNSGGRVTGVVSHYFQSRTQTDSTGFNNFTVSATSGSDNAQNSYRVAWNQYRDTLTLNATVGTGTWESGGGTTPTDTVPPNKINDLGAVPGSSNGTIVLSWTAPGDDGASGSATSYAIRYATLAIDNMNWPAAADVATPPIPQTAGWRQTMTLGGLTPGVLYYVAMKATDDNGNQSLLSTVASAVAKSAAIAGVDSVPPADVSDLTATTGSGSGTINLAWTAPGDDGTVGTAKTYSIRYSMSQINEASWGSATPAGSLPSPQVAGTRQTMILRGLTPGSTYYVAMMTSDDSSNISGLSNVSLAVARATIITSTDSVEVTPVEPSNYAVVFATQPTLVIQNVDTASGNQYYFQVARDSNFIDGLVGSMAIQQQPGLQTSWKVSPALDNNQDYFWRVRVNDAMPVGFSAFSIESTTRAYPNPFRLAENGEVVFTGIPSGSNLLLMTTSGDTVQRWEKTDGSDIKWDGRNESGQQVASGVYLWYVESSDIRGKLIVIR